MSGSNVATCVLQTKQSSIFSSTPMYFRAWVYLTAYTGAADPASVIGVQSSANGGAATGSLGFGSTGLFVSKVSNSGGFDYSNTSTATISENTWTCIELEVDTDYASFANGSLAAWDDATGTADAQLAGTAKLQPLVSASFGLSYSGPSLSTDLYIDDIAISNTYVPCNQ